MRDTACNSHNLQCVICDPVIVLLLIQRTFDKVKVILSRSQHSVGTHTTDCVAANHWIFLKPSDKRCILDCILQRIISSVLIKTSEACDVYFWNCLKPLAPQYCNTPQCLHSRCMHDRNSIIIGVYCFWHVLVADSCFVPWSDFIFNTSKRVGILHTLRRTDSESDTLLLREEKVGLSLVENSQVALSVHFFIIPPDEWTYTRGVLHGTR